MKKTNLLLAILATGSLLTFTSCNKTSNQVTIEVCDDPSNAIRAFQLLVAKNVVAESESASFYKDDQFAFTGSSWTSSDSKVKITLIAENLLVSSMGDYDYACLPCNTAYTGKVSSAKRVAVEDDPAQVTAKANIIAAREQDYANDATYKTKIDVLTDALLSNETSQYFATKYNGVMTCDSSSQIDLRTGASTASNEITDKTIKVCASDVPHAEVLNGVVKGLLATKGYTLQVTILDWTLQNDAVANKDYDANYFQHVPYLNTYAGTTKLFASCKVHYEPLGVYAGKANVADFATTFSK